MKDDLTFEKALDFMATVIISLGILLTLYCLFTMVMVDDNSWMRGRSALELEAILGMNAEEKEFMGVNKKRFNLFGLVYSIGVFLSAILTGVLLRVISNISKNLFEIKGDIKEFKFVYIEKED